MIIISLINLLTHLYLESYELIYNLMNYSHKDKVTKSREFVPKADQFNKRDPKLVALEEKKKRKKEDRLNLPFSLRLKSYDLLINLKKLNKKTSFSFNKVSFPTLFGERKKSSDYYFRQTPKNIYRFGKDFDADLFSTIRFYKFLPSYKAFITRRYNLFSYSLKLFEGHRGVGTFNEGLHDANQQIADLERNILNNDFRKRRTLLEEINVPIANKNPLDDERDSEELYFESLSILRAFYEKNQTISSIIYINDDETRPLDPMLLIGFLNTFTLEGFTCT